MNDYIVEITETLQMRVNIKAKTSDEAVRAIESAYYNQEFILDADHFTGVNFSIDYDSRNEQDIVKTAMPMVYICSPLRGEYEENSQQARIYSRAAVEMGVVPIAPHLLFPQYLDESMAAERTIGLQMRVQLLGRCNELWVCTNHISKGMENEIEFARQMKIPIRRFYAERKELSQPLYQYAVNNSVKGVVNQSLPSVISCI